MARSLTRSQSRIGPHHRANSVFPPRPRSIAPCCGKGCDSRQGVAPQHVGATGAAIAATTFTPIRPRPTVTERTGQEVGPGLQPDRRHGRRVRQPGRPGQPWSAPSGPRPPAGKRTFSGDLAVGALVRRDAPVGSILVLAWPRNAVLSPVRAKGDRQDAQNRHNAQPAEHLVGRCKRPHGAHRVKAENDAHADPWPAGPAPAHIQYDSGQHKPRRVVGVSTWVKQHAY